MWVDRWVSVTWKTDYKLIKKNKYIKINWNRYQIDHRNLIPLLPNSHPKITLNGFLKKVNSQGQRGQQRIPAGKWYQQNSGRWKTERW